MDTDREWERWGMQDPYFGVLTDPRFRSDRITTEDIQLFFATGHEHVHYVLKVTRRHLDADFTPASVLDYGCGVGRLLLPFAMLAERATGIDVSEAMLASARQHAEEAKLGNVTLLHQGDALGLARESFDLVHSSMVLQHVAVERGVAIFGQLVDLVAPGGVGAIQVTYAKALHEGTLGVPPPPPPSPSRGRLLRRARPHPVAPSADPVMLMNSYPLTPLMFQIQRAGIHDLHIDFTDHGGELGVFLFFQKRRA